VAPLGGEGERPGVASVLAVELTSVDDRRLGSINIYWTQLREFTANDIAFANISPAMPLWPWQSR
jgi:hypothetical protein